MSGRSTLRRLAPLCALLALAAILGACANDAPAAAAFPGLSPELNAQLAELRRATDPYRDVQAARDAGYEVLVTHPTTGDRCLRRDEIGGMGFHYLNPDLVDDAVTGSSPEALIYEPQADGSLELVGVEYVIPFAIRSADESAPILFGQEFQRNGTFDLWALHAWVWRDNPNGVFSNYSPAVSCANADAVE